MKNSIFLTILKYLTLSVLTSYSKASYRNQIGKKLKDMTPKEYKERFGIQIKHSELKPAN